MTWLNSGARLVDKLLEVARGAPDVLVACEAAASAAYRPLLALLLLLLLAELSPPRLLLADACHPQPVEAVPPLSMALLWKRLRMKSRRRILKY